MKKKFYLLTIAVLMLGVLAGCGNSSKEDTSLKDIQEKGKIVLGTSADYAPYEWHMIDGKNDEIVGVDIEIAKQVAADLGVELEIKDMQFNGLFSALNSGDIDMIIAGMVADEKRSESVDFTEPYFEQGQVLLVNKKDADTFKSIDDLKGKKIGSQLGSVQYEYANANFDAEVTGIPNNNDLIMELKNGTLDVVFMSELTAKQFAELNDDLVISEIDSIPTEGGSCIAVQKGSSSLVDALNESIKQLNESEKINQWFLDFTELAKEKAN